MRIVFALPLLLAAACSTEHDETNDQVTVQYDQNQLEAASETAGNIAEGIGNDAERAGQAIQNQIGDVDVDVDVSRNEPANADRNAQ